MENQTFLALYKGKGTICNAIVRWWTGSIYSHCEIVVNGICYSSSRMDGGVRCKKIDLNSGRWDVLKIEADVKDRVIAVYEVTKGNKYNWFGIFGAQVINRRYRKQNKFFCSEWCAHALGLPYPQTFAPHTLLAIIGYLNDDKYF